MVSYESHVNKYVSAIKLCRFQLLSMGDLPGLVWGTGLVVVELVVLPVAAVMEEDLAAEAMLMVVAEMNVITTQFPSILAKPFHW